MKKTHLLLIALVAIVVLVSTPVLAQDSTETPEPEYGWSATIDQDANTVTILHDQAVWTWMPKGEGKIVAISEMTQNEESVAFQIYASNALLSAEIRMAADGDLYADRLSEVMGSAAGAVRMEGERCALLWWVEEDSYYHKTSLVIAWMVVTYNAWRIAQDESCAEDIVPADFAAAAVGLVAYPADAGQ